MKRSIAYTTRLYSWVETENNTENVREKMQALIRNAGHPYEMQHGLLCTSHTR